MYWIGHNRCLLKCVPLGPWSGSVRTRLVWTGPRRVTKWLKITVFGVLGCLYRNACHLIWRNRHYFSKNEGTLKNTRFFFKCYSDRKKKINWQMTTKCKHINLFFLHRQETFKCKVYILYKHLFLNSDKSIEYIAT